MGTRHLSGISVIEEAWTNNRKKVRMRIFHLDFIMKRYIELCIEHLVLKNIKWLLPSGMGSIVIDRFKEDKKLNKLNRPDLKTVAINWKETFNLWYKLYPDKTHIEIIDYLKKTKGNKDVKRPIVYYNYDDTNGIIFKIRWKKDGYSRNKSYFKFRPFYSFRKKVSRAIVKKQLL